jgi:dynein light chain LC8-type
MWYCLWAAESTRDKLDPITDWQSQGDDVVQGLKAQFDAAWGPSWHVVIGKNFGSRVTHEARKMTFFYYEDKACLVFKA